MTLSESALKILENALDLLNKTISDPKAQRNIRQEARNHLNRYPAVKEELFPTGLYAELNWAHISIAVMTTLVVGGAVIVPIMRRVIAKCCFTKHSKSGQQRGKTSVVEDALSLQHVQKTEGQQELTEAIEQHDRQELQELRERLCRLRGDAPSEGRQTINTAKSNKIPKLEFQHENQRFLQDSPQTFIQRVHEFPFIDESSSRASIMVNNPRGRNIELPSITV